MSNMREGSPAPSLYSLDPARDAQFLFRQVHGRTLNSQNDTYFLPADREEHSRLELQHQVYRLCLGGLYPAQSPVRWALRPRSGMTLNILDVGTGSGSWAIDMAREFPHCNVVGVDLVPPQTQNQLPTNCRFEIDDANLGFPHYRNTFDVVHARAISSGIRDFPQFLNELAQCLRPGGVLLLGDGELQLYDEDRRPLAYSQPQATSTQRLFFATYNAMKNRGGSVDSPYMSPTWLRGVDSLTDVGWQKEFIPIGPWIYANEREMHLAEMLRRNTLGFISGMGPLLLSEGYLQESVATMKREAFQELQELRVRLYTRWSFAWAVKKLA